MSGAGGASSKDWIWAYEEIDSIRHLSLDVKLCLGGSDLRAGSIKDIGALWPGSLTMNDCLVGRHVAELDGGVGVAGCIGRIHGIHIDDETSADIGEKGGSGHRETAVIEKRCVEDGR